MRSEDRRPVVELHHRLNMARPSLVHSGSGASLSRTSLEPSSSSSGQPPSLYGIPLKYLSLVTLALQNASLSVLMHYSRVSVSPSAVYSAATAVLMNELLKGSISFAIALSRVEDSVGADAALWNAHGKFDYSALFSRGTTAMLRRRLRQVQREVFSDDCWKLSIPAILYVIQNNLQYVASANLDVVVFQVSYQMKILTTAAFSVLLLRKRLGPAQWVALVLLAVGVAIVQIQATSPQPTVSSSSSSKLASHARTPADHHESMRPFRGFTAVIMACFTSGLAGVYFEMVLKGSKADLWIRNLQLSIFSIVPALVPILFGPRPLTQLFSHFGVWAWATVLTQVAGGLITALVIKFSDNIMKGFATSLSIVISFLASVILFNFHITPAFLIGSTIVLAATWMYNQSSSSGGGSAGSAGSQLNLFQNTKRNSYTDSIVSADSPILGQTPDKKRRSLIDLSPRGLTAAFGLSSSSESLGDATQNGNGAHYMGYSSPTSAHSTYSNVPSRTSSPPLSMRGSKLSGKKEGLHLR